MDYDKIKFAVCTVYEKCEVYRLPFDCIDLISKLGFSCVKYSSLNETSRGACLQLSDDATTLDNTIYYNDKKTARRIRFSLMHELGHLILDTQDEAEANTFASNILAPSMAVYYSKLTNIREIANLFDVSLECAKYAYEACKKWNYSATHYGMTETDKRLYTHFFDSEVNRFVFKKAPCSYCDTIVYNSNIPLCTSCGTHKPVAHIADHHDLSFSMARGNWLYGGL